MAHVFKDQGRSLLRRRLAGILQTDTQLFFQLLIRMNKYLTLLASLPIAVQCGEVVWSGIFDSSATVADFDKCAFHRCLFYLVGRYIMHRAGG